MFGGLEIKGDTEPKKEEEPTGSAVVEEGHEDAPVAPEVPTTAAAAATAPSGFSFLSNPVKESSAPSAPVSAPSPAPVASGFSFMSSLGGDNEGTTASSTTNNNDGDKGMDAAEDDNEDAAVAVATSDVKDAAGAPSSSGFSFMMNMSTDTTMAAKEDEPNTADVNVEEIPSSMPEPEPQSSVSSSSFSFLSSASSAPVPAPTLESKEPVPTLSAQSSLDNNASMFSMLTMKTSQEASKPPLPSTSWGDASAPSPAPAPAPPVATAPKQSAHDDILSLSNPKQPTGSGVVFGGAARPRTVKKRTRGRKIGAGVNNAANPSSIGGTSASALPPPSPIRPNVGKMDVEEDKNFTQLSKDADNAALRAEEFLKQQQHQHQTQPSSYMGRYAASSDTVEEDYGEDNDDDGTNKSIDPHDDEDDGSEEYKKAKAAAEEACRNPPRKVGFGSGMGMSIGGFSFFKRNASNNSSSTTISNSMHGGVVDTPKDHKDTKIEKERPREPVKVSIPVYGEANLPSTDEDNHNNNIDDDGQDDKNDLDELKRQHDEYERKQMERMEKARREQEKREEEEKERQRQIRRKEEEERVAAEVEAEAKRQRERSPSVKLTHLIEEFSQKSQNATLSVSTLRQERSALLSQRSASEQQLKLASQQKLHAERQQLQAAEKEDFELADELMTVIAQHESEEKEFARVLEQVDESLTTLDDRRLDVCQAVRACFDDGQHRLRELLDELEGDDALDQKDTWNKFENDTRRLAAEKERLSADEKNIERDEGFVQQERTELEEQISEQTSGMENQKLEAQERLDSVQAEIDLLRQQLEEKELEAAGIKMEIHSSQDGIDTVRNSFRRQLTRLSKKESAIAESRHEWESEHMAYTKSREDHEAEVTAHSEAVKNQQEMKERMKKEIDIAGELAKVVAQEVVVVGSGSSSLVEEINDEGLVQARAFVLESEAALEDAHQLLRTALSHIDSLNNEISEIDTKLPILEADKKLAASKRDFKAAARASKQIKEMVAQREQSVTEAEGMALDQQQDAEKEVEKCKSVLEEKKALAHELEKKGGTKRMIHLVQKMIKLEKLREEICGVPGDDVESDQLESFKTVGGFVLDAEIGALLSEGEELDKKFGGWDEIIMEYASKLDSGDLTEDEEKSIVDLAGTAETPASSADSQVDDEVDQHTELDDEDAAVADDGKDQEEEEKEEEDSAEKISQFYEMTLQLKALESKLEVAIEEEEYDDAAIIDEKIITLSSTMDALGLSEEEKETAINTKDQSSSEPPESAPNKDLEDDGINKDADDSDDPSAYENESIGEEMSKILSKEDGGDTDGVELDTIDDNSS